MPTERLLIAMKGLPRSGKSTIAQQLSRVHGIPVVSRDAIRLALTGRRYVALAEPTVKATSLLMVRSLFLAGHSIIIYDETCYSRATRDGIKSPEWRTVFYEVNTPPEVCIERAILTDQLDLISVITAMYARHEPLGVDEERYLRSEAN